MAPCHRLDLGLSLIKKGKRFESRWVFGVFNAYNRKNPYYIDIESNHLQNPDGSGNRATQYRFTQMSLFPVIPSISYQFKF
jgi:hypothetical protein